MDKITNQPMSVENPSYQFSFIEKWFSFLNYIESNNKAIQKKSLQKTLK